MSAGDRAVDPKQYPLFWCLSAAAQARLMQLHFDLTGTRLTIPPEIKITTPKASIVLGESEDEIDREMRQKPRYKGAVWSGR